MQLDLMTPGLYMRGALRAALTIATSSCPAAGSTLELVLYPVLDYNFYKALHSAANAAVHLLVGLPIITFHRYGSLASRLALRARRRCARAPRGHTPRSPALRTRSS